MKRWWPCRGCAAKEEEIERLQEQLRWFEGQLDAQNKRLVEIADPRANERVVQAERLEKRPHSPLRAAPAAGPILPGTEPAPPPMWEVDAEES
jgi:hypothetical protein